MLVQTNYRLVTIQLCAGLELLVLSTSGNPTIQAAVQKVCVWRGCSMALLHQRVAPTPVPQTRDLVLKLPAALNECRTLPKDQCPKLSEFHPSLAGCVVVRTRCAVAVVSSPAAPL